MATDLDKGGSPRPFVAQFLGPTNGWVYNYSPVFDVTSRYPNGPPNGAAGDGFNDDTAAINAAISAAQSAGGGIVYFPVGQFLISSQLSIPPNVSLVGVSSADDILNVAPITSIKASTSFLKSIAMVSFQKNWCGRFENFVIDGNQSATIGLLYTSSRFGSTRNIFVRKLGNNLSTDTCLLLTTDGSLTMANCIFDHVYTDQFTTAAGTNGCVISGATGAAVTGCVFINCGFGIPFGNAYSLSETGPSGTDTSDNNWFYGCGFVNNSATIPTTQFVNCQEIRFFGCVFLNLNGVGNAIYVKNNGADIICTNCYFNSANANYSIDTNGKLTFNSCTQNDVLYTATTNPISTSSSPQTYTNTTPVAQQILYTASSFSAVTFARAGSNTGLQTGPTTFMVILEPRDSLTWTFTGTLNVTVIPLA